jgi:hypothetical protein
VTHGIVEFMRDMVCFHLFINHILCYGFLVVATWTFFGFLCLYMVRVNLSVAIVAMTTPESLKNKSVEACPSNTNDSSDTPAKVDSEIVFYDNVIKIILFYSMVNLIGILVCRVTSLGLFFTVIFFLN